VKAVTRAGWLAYGLAIIVVGLDQAIKAWVVRGLGLVEGVSTPVWGPLRFTLVGNKGVSYGFLSSDAAWTPWALASFSLIVAVALILWVRRAEKTILGLSLGLIIGGAVGNLIDRVRLGAVVDFIDIQRLHFPWVFNVADSAITVGIVMLIAESLVAPRQATGSSRI
jgi:signal peptidase II